jgi:hypothetical protein
MRRVFLFIVEYVNGGGEGGTSPKKGAYLW